MSVIGFEFGNESCYVAVAKAGGIETIANDYSLRATPSCVAFTEKNRVLGVAAKNQQITNMKNTIGGFKHLLGRKYDDPIVQKELQTIPYEVIRQQDGSIGIVVQYLEERKVFTPEQLTGMLFTKLKDTSSVALQAQINDCVIAVPSYFTNSQRKALGDSAALSGLNCLRLVNETTATGLSYGFYRTDLPPPEEKARNVIFVDFGHSSIQISAIAFNKSKLKILAATAELVGGRDVDMVLAMHFVKEFIERYKLDARNDKRAMVRLLAEVEKLKKQMSANSTKLPLNIECFMNDKDVQSSLSRTDMEDMCADLFRQIERAMRKCLSDSKLELEDIHSVEIVGGSSRIPAVKTLIEQIFGKNANTTLNQDEAVARGAALQCAIMSPAVRVRDFGCIDIQPYSVTIGFDKLNGQPTKMEVYYANHQAPFSRVLTISQNKPFDINLFYTDPETAYDSSIGTWKVNEVRPSANGEGLEVQVKVRINHNGIVLVTSAQMVEKKEVEVTEVKEAANGNENEPQSPDGQPLAGEQTVEGSDEEHPNNTTTDPNEKSSKAHSKSWFKGWFSSEDKKEKEKKKKAQQKITELPIVGVTHGFTQADFEKYYKEEELMIMNDLSEKERVDNRNALEEYVYEVRGKLQEDGELEKYVEAQMRNSICQELEQLENWLYEDGENCSGAEYKEKLNALHTKTDPIKARQVEFTNFPVAMERLGASIQQALKAISAIRSKDPKYDHLTELELMNIEEQCQKTKKYQDTANAKLSKASLIEDPPLKVSDIVNEEQTLRICVNSVINRAKPRPATPPPAPAKEEANKEEPQPEQPRQERDNMDVD